MRRGAVLGVVSSLLALVLVAAPASAQEDGEALFRTNCAGCHGADGAGVPGLFPPLVDNPHVEDAEYVSGVIRNGRTGEIEVNGVTYNGQMPGFPNLTDAEVDAIVGHVQIGLGAPTTDTTLPPVAITPIPEDALLGQRLFLGQQRLVNGGPACAACHAAGRHGDLSPKLAYDSETGTANWQKTATSIIPGCFSHDRCTAVSRPGITPPWA
jgi:mono/diheme cytochrome c family protein